MLKQDNTSRPDNNLKRSLLVLAYFLVLLTIVVSLFLRYPEYFIFINLGLIIITIICLLLTISALRNGEKAMSYGGFANELIKKNPHIARIENVQGDVVIQNDKARDLLQNIKAIQFVDEHLSEARSNSGNFAKLELAAEKLKNEKVELVLNENGKEKYYMVSVTPLFLRKIDIFEEKLKINKVKNDAYLFWCLEDVTAEKNLEQIFFEERKYLHDFIDLLPVGLYTCDKDYTIEYANEAFAAFLRTTPAKLQKQNLKNFVSSDCEFFEAKAAYEGPAFFNVSEDYAESFVFQDTVRENKKTKIRGLLLQNLPNDAKLLDNIYEASNKINWLFNSAPVGILFLDRKGSITGSNQKAIDILGYNPEGSEIFAISEDKESLSKTLNSVAKKITSSAFSDIHLKQQDKEKILRIYVTPMKKLHTNTDVSDGFVLYLIDATEQKNLELQFAQAQKMQAMGQLAGGVAHDFNNLLTAMIGFCDLLLQKHGVGDPSFSDLIQIKQNANRAAVLVRQLLAFSRKQPLKPKLIEVTENFVDLHLMLKRILGEQIDLKFYHGQNLGFIKVDPVQFSQVIINLAVNAKDAMNGKGTLTISTRTETITENFQFGDNTIEAGEFVAIDVADTGCGISAENLSRIFEPFFSTKQNVVGSGTGLGLSTVYGIVQQTKGFIKVKSTPKKGTTFSIYLPKFDSQAEGSAEISEKGTKEKPNAVGMGQNMIFGLNLSKVDSSREQIKDVSNIKILFTEDEDSVRAFAVRALKKKGFNVVACNSAENALEKLEEEKDFSLLITDMVMPGMNGVQLAEKVKKQIPDIKIILASGYSEEIARKELKSDADFDFIAKPFSLGDLTQKVFDVLNK